MEILFADTSLEGKLLEEAIGAESISVEVVGGYFIEGEIISESSWWRLF